MTTTDWKLAKNQWLGISEESSQSDSRIYDVMRNFWHPVMFADDLDAQPVQAMLCGEQLAIVRMGGEVRAYKDLCAHRGTALSLGTVVDNAGCEELRCAYHGWQYDHAGRLTAIPQRPDLVGKIRARVQTYHAVDRYGLIWVCLAETPHFPMAEFPQFDDAGYHAMPMKTVDWQCTSPRRVENYLDLGHFAFVHDGYLGDINHPEVPRHAVWREGHVLRIEQLEPNKEPVNTKFESDMDDSEIDHHADGSDEAYTLSDQEWWVTMPLTVLLNQTLPGDRHYYLFFHPTPITPGTIRNFTVHARNYGDADKMDEEVLDFCRTVYAQDKPIVEAQRPEALHSDLSYELHLQDVDTVSMQYRLWLGELVEALEGED